MDDMLTALLPESWVCTRLAIERSEIERLRATGEPRARPIRCTRAGGNGSRTVSKCAFAITASRSGFGIPLRFVLPSAASANIVSSSASNWRAGRTSQTKWASSSPAFQNLCGMPAGTERGVQQHRA